MAGLRGRAGDNRDLRHRSAVGHSGNGPATAARGAKIAAALWFGFAFSTWATDAFEARGIPILAIKTGYPLVGMLIMGLVIGARKAKPRGS